MSAVGSTTSTPQATTHRLAAVSASVALRKASAAGNSISTGSREVDGLLAGGLTKGKITEVYGAPGSGKSTLGITAGTNALLRGSSVVWIDCSHPVCLDRFVEIANAKISSNTASRISLDRNDRQVNARSFLSRLHHYTVPTLAHLLSLFLCPPVDFPPAETGLIVVESVSSVFSQAFPQYASSSSSSFSSHGNSASLEAQASARRFTLQRDLVAALAKVAAVADAAVLITNQVATRIDRDVVGPTSERSRAVLRPALNTRAWTERLWARVGLVRHWGPRIVVTRSESEESSTTGTQDTKLIKNITRFAGLTKFGSTEYDIFGRVILFEIDKSGFVDAPLGTLSTSRNASSTMHSQATKTFNTSITTRPVQPDVNKQRAGTTIGLTSTVPAKRTATEIADSESDEDGGRLDEADEEEADLEVLDELGLTREQRAILDLEMEQAADAQDGAWKT